MCRTTIRFLLVLCAMGIYALPAVGQPVASLPIHIVYVNHVEVESVIQSSGPLIDGTVYTATPEQYAFTSGQIAWEIAEAEAVGAAISFHMSGAYAERASAAGHQSLWAGYLAGGHTVGVHFHSFLRGPGAFLWRYRLSPTQPEIVQAWLINHDLPGALVGPEALWVGESHYACDSCWTNLGYRLRATEQMALLPEGQHIVWLVERSQQGRVTYPHFPQIGQAGWHGGQGNQIYFDLRLPQLKKEFLMLYLEWLERERLGLPAQVWCFGWCNHAGQNTVNFGTEISAMLAWLADDFVGRVSPRGNLIAQFAGDHLVSDVYEDYETWGDPLPSPLTNVNDQFPYLASALTDAGVTADLTADLGLPGVRLIEMERSPSQGVYLLFRETDGEGSVDISGVLAAQGISQTTLLRTDVSDGVKQAVQSGSLLLGSEPLVLEAAAFGDVNCDGRVDGLDVQPFVLALLDPAGYELAYPNCESTLADVNGDGAVDGMDVQPLVEAVLGG